jgi:hypothetical protein
MSRIGAKRSTNPDGRGSRRSASASGRAAVVVALLLLTILPPAAFGEDPAVDQYVESVPGAGGDRPALPPDVRQELHSQGGADAAALADLVTSPRLGAPGDTAPRADRAEVREPKAASSPSVLDAVTSAASGGDGGAGPWLLGGLALLSAALAGGALARRRSPAR